MARLRRYRALLAMAVLAIGITFTFQSAEAANINIINLDGPGEGFNDTTPVTPVGGNPGTTLGEQRLNCFIRAAQIWEAILSSDITIDIDANMDPLFCDATSAILGSAGPNTVHRNYSGAPMTNTWYVQAEANSHAGYDLSPGTSDGAMTFNSNLNGDPGCLGGLQWYYGFDESPPGSDIDFVTVLVHEMCHVLGFLTLIDADGSLFLSGHDTYERLMYHNGASPPDYPSMTDAQRAAGNIADPNLVFDGYYTNLEAVAIPLTSGMTNGRTRLHGPDPFEGGSSLSHWSNDLSPNQVMEPYYTGPDHTPQLDPHLLRDIGWTLLTPPECAVTPTSIDFGTVSVGSSKDSTFTIKNTGEGTLNGSVSESCPDYDLISGGGAYTLAAGESLVVTVRFEPLTSGVKPCTIETGDALCSDVSCTGIGEIPPICAVTPTSIDFGTVTVGSSKDLTFTIENIGGGTLEGSVSESCPDYALFSGGGSYSLAAGEWHGVIVRFAPLSSGVKLCTIETGDALCSDVSCTGTGEDPPACAVTPTSIDFGTVTVGSWKDSTFTIKNTGGGTLNGSVSESCDDYDLVSGGGAYTLAAGESLVVTVRFEPLTSGVKPCTIETGDALCSDVSCTGVGEDPSACAVTPTSIDFGTVTIGSSKDSTFTIKNTGGGTLNGSVSESCDDYDLVSGGGAYTLAAGESLVVTVRFEPLTTGEKPCTIETGDALCSDVSCTGIGDIPSGDGTALHTFALYQNHPNPFNPTTWIGFSLDRESMVSLIIYDISGTRVRTLVNRKLTAGTYTEEWNARDNQGRLVASGIYFYRLSSENRTLTRKLILLR